MKIPAEATFQPFMTSPERVFTTVRSSPELDTALIFLDTNVLLAPYRASSEALTAIQKTYTKLRDEARLIVPGQVAREFGRNRPNLLAQLHKQVRASRSLSINGRLEDVPILIGTPEYLEARKHFEEMAAALKACRNAIDNVVSRIESWQFSDPVLDVYRPLFDSGVVRELSLDAASLEAARRMRYEARMPPGFRDKGKDDGGVGDLAIWITVLEVSSQAPRDAILVTEDSKDDWFHRSSDQRLFPRYELVEEFAERTSGKSFGITSLSALLKRHGATESVVQEVKEHERAFRFPGLVDMGELARRAEEIVFHRLSAAGGPSTVIIRRTSFPDLIVDSEGMRLGVEILMFTGHASLDRRASDSIARAQAAVRDGLCAEITLVFVAHDAVSSKILREWFAKPPSWAPGVTAIASRVLGESILVMSNQSTQALLLRALPVYDTFLATSEDVPRDT